MARSRHDLGLDVNVDNPNSSHRDWEPLVDRSAMNKWMKWPIAAAIAGTLGFAYWKLAIPTHRIEVRSELVMLGDLDADRRWTENDLRSVEAAITDPSSLSDDRAWLSDMNQNGLIDAEDIAILRTLVEASGDPYTAKQSAQSKGQPFPRPRELYRYASVAEFRSRPLWALPYPFAADSVLDWMVKLAPPTNKSAYADALNAAIYSEAIRFDQGWRKRKSSLQPAEIAYAMRKFVHIKRLHEEGDRFELLLSLIDAVEDVETLTVNNQPEFSLKLLAFRDHLREVLNSPLYADFKIGKTAWRSVLKVVAEHIQSDLGLTYDFETLPPPRDLSHLENYLQRAEWQYYKSATREQDFLALVSYAQHDARYLRAVSRTTRKLRDLNVENHNLPMVLLFREALRIRGGDKKQAVGLLDEAIRIPYAWVKSIPRETLPGSLALDNFLLPGNKEDGADKSRHWNVFGGVSLYKSPQEAFDLALRREMQDLHNDNYSEEGMREFFRDMIANLNGMYHVITVNPALLAPAPRR